ncbi:SMP-30/gluconolactonase/LRE family protein [Novosphingobium sp. AAP93]|uniref:SMP-30/gluconolactonase/LRE family protein n=1 Tax=Novosphingobium sp. AAP93 TaxID=1523427 RepID=UPI0006B9A981|nr:SMP-30/gluconolactonase/LRE family protein [Novosphingobium sp. AAP93]KPF82960.1 gluconolaconase [Novosphingobium sp. AAP93]
MTAVRAIPRDTCDILGEGLLWSARENALFWTDILGRKLWRMSLADDAICHWDMPEAIGWIIERAAGGFVVGLASGFYRLDLDPFHLELIANPQPERPGNRLNDAKADAHGRIWAGSMPFLEQPATNWPPTGALYRLDPDGTISRHDDGITIANGPALSPDGTVLYHTDSRIGQVWKYALNAEGSLGPREPHLHFDGTTGSPDGMTCDRDGGLWIAFYGGGRIARFHPDGMLDREIALPTPQITNVCFAGADLTRMFATSAGDGRPNDTLAGALFEIEAPGAIGLEPHQYRG